MGVIWARKGVTKHNNYSRGFDWSHTKKPYNNYNYNSLHLYRAKCVLFFSIDGTNSTLIFNNIAWTMPHDSKSFISLQVKMGQRVLRKLKSSWWRVWHDCSVSCFCWTRYGFSGCGFIFPSLCTRNHLFNVPQANLWVIPSPAVYYNLITQWRGMQ